MSQRHEALGIHPIATDGEDGAELLQRQQVVRRTRIIALVVLLLLALGSARIVVLRMANAAALKDDLAVHAQLHVRVTSPQTAKGAQALTLPGTLQGFVQSPIAARASGYLKRWTHDIGSRVSKGELLAEIETPEIDEQLTQAVAARGQASATLALARSSATRWEALRQKDVVSQQELDERRSAVAAATANLAAAEANVQRLRQTEAFKRVVAPFSGVITRRNVDVGDLIDAGSGGGGRALFTLAQTDPLRVYVNVPQSYAQRVHAGLAVTVTQSELRGRRFDGKVARTAGAIDTATRQMQVEVNLANPDGVLLPGAYVQVELPLPASDTLTLPGNALIFRAEGTRVALVDGQGRVQLRSVTLGRYLGDAVEILDGVQGSDRVVLNPPDSLADGDQVTIAKEAA